MDVIIGIASKIGEYLVEPIGRQFGYLIYYNSNGNNLVTEMEKLDNIEKEVQLSVNRATRNGETIVPPVETWLVNVNEMKKEAQMVLQDHQQFKSSQSCHCCWHKSRYSLSRRAKKKSIEVAELQEGGKFKIVSHPTPLSPWPHFKEEDSSDHIGLKSISEEVLEALRDDEINMIGIYGSDSVGKTKLVKLVAKRAIIKGTGENLFDDVAMSVVTETVNKRKIQRDLAELLGLRLDEESSFGRANRLFLRIKNAKNKTLIILDDVWEKLDLDDIGIPFGSEEEYRGIKIIVTSLSETVCNEMKSQKNFNMPAVTAAATATYESFGPFGGQGGHPWNDGVFTTVRQMIVVFNGHEITSIRIEYDQDGQSAWSMYHGEKFYQGETNTVKLGYPDEFLISISGYYRAGHNSVIHSLKFESNKKTYGPFGNEIGDYFSSPSNVGKIVGFHGRCGHFLDSFGAHYEPISSSGEYRTTGVFGGRGGGRWDDGKNTAIRKLTVFFDDNVINSISVEYDKDGRLVTFSPHGVNTGVNREINLIYPDEFIISVSGFYRKYNDRYVVSSLTFQTNRKKFGPFGKESGNTFSFPSTIAKIVGFHGTSGLHLDSIGAHFEPLSNS